MSLKEELIKISHRIYEKEFVAAYDGNLSVRTKNNTVLITRSAVCKGELEIDDIIEIDLTGRIVSGKGKISTENKIHLLLYNHRPDVNAVIHAHPIYSTAIASSKNLFEKPVFPEVVLTIGRIPLCKYSTPSTSELTESMIPFIADSKVFLLENHGVVSAGENLTHAYYLLEKLEHTAKILINTEILGGVKQLSNQNLKSLYEIALTVYNLNIKDGNKF